MTEQEWLESTDPIAMRLFFFGPIERIPKEVYTSRKGLLLACACFSPLEKLLPPKARLWQQHAELAAEGQYEWPLNDGGEEADWELLGVQATSKEAEGRLGALVETWSWTDTPNHYTDEGELFWKAERSEHAKLIRDIFGNPFRSVTLNSSWRTSTVLALATSIYDDRAFDRLPALANALEEAGCTNADILNHCRSEGPHVRGCWVVDLILGKQ